MTVAELEKLIEAVIPGAAFETDNYGQILIYTGLMKKDDKVVDFIEEDPEKEQDTNPYSF